MSMHMQGDRPMRASMTIYPMSDARTAALAVLVSVPLSAGTLASLAALTWASFTSERCVALRDTDG